MITFDLDLMLADLDSPDAATIEGARIGLALWLAARRDLDIWIIRKN